MPSYEVKDKVLGLHGQLLYPAKVLKIREIDGRTQYRIHYQGWKARYDEWVESDRIIKDTEANRGKMDELKNNFDAQRQRASAGRKRKRNGGGDEGSESEPSAGSSTKISLPSQFKKRLVTDWENINRNEKIMNLPVTPSVTEILDQFSDSVPSDEKGEADAVRQVVRAVKIFFKHALGAMLLYKFERPQFEDFDFSESDVGDVYGAEHLLRLFVKLPKILSHCELTPKQRDAVKRGVGAICSYMVKYKQHVFTGTYARQGAGYAERAKGAPSKRSSRR